MKIYIDKLLQVLPMNITTCDKPFIIDLVLDGGAFNGSYLIGVLMFLKEMERKKYVIVDKISACSVSTLCGLLYYLDKLEYGVDMYEDGIFHVKNTNNLNIFEMYFNKINHLLDQTTLRKISNKLFCTYYNVVQQKKVVKCKYLRPNDMYETIRRSCFLPYIMNGRMTYKNKYIDGITPYKIPARNGRKTLYIDLFGWDKIKDCMSVKNEKNNFHRVLKGALDVQLFFMKGSPTSMCRYLDNWTDFKFYDTLCIKRYIEWFVIKYIVVVFKLEKIFINKTRYPNLFSIYQAIVKRCNAIFINHCCV